MENVAYVMRCMPQMCSVKRANYGKRSIFNDLQAADVLCEARELWKTYYILRLGHFWTIETLQNTIKRRRSYAVHLVLLETAAFFHEHLDFLWYFLVPNHSLLNTHKNVRPVYSRRPPVFLHFAR
jgi:hypothetical protein